MSRHRNIAYVCTWCGNPFIRSSRYAYRYKSEGQRPFCCHTCYTLSKRIGHVDEIGYINNKGYRVIVVDGKHVLEHRFIAEKGLGFKIPPGKHVHHIDGNRLNNTLENLRVITKAEHTMEHYPLSWDIETAKTLRAEGFTLKEIGQKFGVTAQAIHSGFRHRGLTRKRSANSVG